MGYSNFDRRQTGVFRNILIVFLYLYILLSLVVPVAVFNKIFFVLICFIYLPFCIFRLPTLSPVVLLVVFIYGFVLSLVSGNYDIVRSVQFITAVLTYFLIFPIVRFKIDMTLLLKKAGIVYMVICIAFFIAAVNQQGLYEYIPFGGVLFRFLSPILNGSFVDFFETYGNCRSGIRTISALPTFSAFLGNQQFIVLPASLYLMDFINKKNIRNLILVLMSVLVLLFTGLRAPMVTFVIIISYLIFKNMKGEMTKIILSIVIFSIIIFALFFLITSTSFFSVNEYSNSVKLGHIESYFASVTPNQLLFGDGLASYYYSAGTGGFMSYTEINIIDILRYFGVLFSIIIYLFILNPVRYSKIICRQLCEKELFIFLNFFLMALTNPLLFNSIGSLSILWYWSILIQKNKRIINAMEITQRTIA